MKQVILFRRLACYRAFPFSLGLLLLLLCALNGCSRKAGSYEPVLERPAQKEEKNNEEVKRDFFPKDTRISRQSLPLPRGFSAHRGRLLGHSHPDNSRAAIKEVLRAKVPYLELDLRRAFDGDIYLYHDKTIGVDGSKVPFDTVMGDWLVRNNPQIVDLETAFVFICREEKGADNSGTLLQLDIKEARARVPQMVEEVIAVASRLDTDSCSIQDRKSNKDVSHKANDTVTSTVASKLIFQCQDMTCARYLAGHKTNVMWLAQLHQIEELSEILRLQPEIVQIDLKLVTDDLIKRIQQTGALVSVKALGVNDNQQTWEMLRKKGVDIILTDLGA